MSERHANYARTTEGAVQKAQAMLTQAYELYDECMKETFPLGTIWSCTHGSRGKYPVAIKEYDRFRHGYFLVENYYTGKRKRVHVTELH